VDGLLVAKLLAPPLLIGVVTLVERRFGHTVAGLVAGLPLSSIPLSIFLALEQGTAFARDAVPGQMAGITAVAAFLLGYGWSAPRAPWWLAMLAGLVQYGAVALILGAVHLSLPWATLLGAASLLGAAALMPRKLPPAGTRPHAWWELPLRMAVAAALVVTLTAAARGLGPHATGLLGPFPVFSCVVGGFMHKRAGAGAAVRLLRAVAVGALSYVAFFAVVGATLTHWPMWSAYGTAALAAAGTSSITWRIKLGKKPAPSPTT